MAGASVRLKRTKALGMKKNAPHPSSPGNPLNKKKKKGK